MSDEIKVRLSVNATNSPFKHTIAPGQVEIDQSTIGRGGYTQTIGTSEEAIDVGDVTTEGCLFLQNLDDTNFVEYGCEAGSGGMASPAFKLKAGEVAWMRLAPGAALRAKADTAAVKLEVCCFED